MVVVALAIVISGGLAVIGAAGSDLLGWTTLILAAATFAITVLAALVALRAYEIRRPNLSLGVIHDEQRINVLELPVSLEPAGHPRGDDKRWVVTDKRFDGRPFSTRVRFLVENISLVTARHPAVRVRFSGCALAGVPLGWSGLHASSNAEPTALQNDSLAEAHPGWAVWVDLDLRGLHSPGSGTEEHWLMQVELVADEALPEEWTIPIHPIADLGELATVHEGLRRLVDKVRADEPKTRQALERLSESQKKRNEVFDTAPRWLIASIRDDYSGWVKPSGRSTPSIFESALGAGQVVDLQSSADGSDRLLNVRERIAVARQIITKANDLAATAEPSTRVELIKLRDTLFAIDDPETEEWFDALERLAAAVEKLHTTEQEK